MNAMKTVRRGAGKRPASDSPVLALPLTGAAFIEASAGTGKTHALTSLVARLVVEGEGQPLDRILLVTFTRAATSELRDRVRRTLRSVLDAVSRRALNDAAAGAEDGGADSEAATSHPDPQAAELLRVWEERDDFDPMVAARRLEAALHDIDRANIFTIHGFCQRMLKDFAFEGGLPFMFERSGDDRDMVAREARDFWRRRFQDASLLHMRHVSGSGFYPDEIAKWTLKWRAKMNIDVRGGEPPAGALQAAETAWNGLYETTRVLWHEHRDELQREMLEGEWVDRRSYRKLKVEEDMNTLEAFFTTLPPRLPPEDQNKDKGPLTRYGRKILASKCKGGKELPENPLFDAFDRLKEESQALREIFDQSLRQARRDALLEMRDSLRVRVRDERRLTYDDQLLELDAALEDRESGARLARRIRRAFTCVLIDEYQDTDPVQTRIFERIYGNGRGDTSGGEGGRDGVASAGPDQLFVVVGDPKQSIYRFRGTDVFAYIAARKKVEERRSLLWNWRSVSALVNATNALFAGTDSFLTSEIGYLPVNANIAEDAFHILPRRESGGGKRAARADPADTPLRLWLVPRDAEEGKPFEEKNMVNRGAMNRIVLSTTANEIARLLALGESGEAGIDGRPLTGADIAVLTRTRRQGQDIAKHLRERGVRCVEIDDASVFMSREAEQLERFLRALIEPGQEARARGALAGDLFGLDVAGMFALNEDDEEWGAWKERLTAWHAEWEGRGIGVLLRSLLDTEGAAKCLLERDDGLRRLTNFRHLAELLQEEEARRQSTPAELAVWFSRRRADAAQGAGRADEDTRLRLSSDEQLVRIMTIHVAKGLEFPVVFCPFLWSEPGERSEDVAYHLGAEEAYREVLDLAPDERSRKLARLEEFAESLRLAYVALTRAKYRCVVAWGQVKTVPGRAKDIPDSSLAWLLHRHRAPSEGVAPAQPQERMGQEAATVDERDETIAALARVASHLVGLGPDAWRAEVEEYAARCPDNAVSVEVLDAQEPSPPVPLRTDEPSEALVARELTRTLRRVRQMTSFTGLSHFAAKEEARAIAEEEPGAEAERPDHDEHQAWSPAAAEEGADEGGADEDGEESDAPRTAFTFPRGATVGKYVHRIFEHLDDPSRAPVDLDRIHENASREFGIDPVWQPVVRAMVKRTREVRLAASEGGKGGFCLADPLRRLVELEFAFPVKGLAHEALGVLLAAHDYPNPFAPGSEQDGAEEDGAVPAPIDGFLRGFIDLTIEHDGRWYIVDYKSNWLGPAPEDYAPENIEQAMRASRYSLQYLLYVVALHRYLGLRLADYDYERHLGGVFYLFVRGIDPAAGLGRGIFFDRPTLACVSALDNFFREGAA